MGAADEILLGIPVYEWGWHSGNKFSREWVVLGQELPNTIGNMIDSIKIPVSHSYYSADEMVWDEVVLWIPNNGLEMESYHKTLFDLVPWILFSAMTVSSKEESFLVTVTCFTPT